MRIHRHRSESGFTLLEALVAIALLAMVVLHFLATRTEALKDAADARNRRVAREIAAHQLSILRAGAHELPPENRVMLEAGDDYPNFRYQILIGESAISEAESDMAEGYGDDEDEERADRLEWQREREMLRSARFEGLSFTEYEDRLLEEELEVRIPSEDEFEDVAVVVYFPDVLRRDVDVPVDATFMLKAKISTMAIEGLTPEQAEVVAESRGGGTSASDAPSGQ